MKQSRRHELKTNELSIWLQQTYEAAARHANYLIGGLVAVVLILLIALYVQNRRHQARERAWQDYYQLQDAQPARKPEAMDEARSFAEKHAADDELAPRALLTVAELASAYAHELDPRTEADKRLALLKEARDNYTRVLNDHTDHPRLVAQARMGLALVLETLTLAGQATREDVRTQYEQIEKSDQGLYGETAKYLASSLDERLKPLQLVATRPAELPPLATNQSATAPATPAAEALPSAPATMPEMPATTSAPGQ